MSKKAAFLGITILCGFSIVLNLYQEICISKFQHTIATQRLVIELLQVPAEDSIRFACRRCGHPHNLSANDTTKTNKKP